MTFRFHKEAEKELAYSVDYYERIEKGLGVDFSIEVNSTITNILAYPLAWTKLDNNIRRCLVNRFPFSVLYTIENELIYILAVMHLRRDPDYWKVRIKK